MPVLAGELTRHHVSLVLQHVLPAPDRFSGRFVFCRKATATAFATNAPVAASDFVVIEGESALKAFDSSPGVHRLFCSNCGSPIISRRDAMPDVVRLRLGTLDTPLPAPTTAHYFVGSKAEWYEIHDDLPQFAER